MIHRLQLSHAVLGAEVQLLRDLLFEAIAEPATAARARAIHGERIATLRQDVMIRLESLFGPEIAAGLDSQRESMVGDSG